MNKDDEGYEKKRNQIPKLDFEIVRCMKNIENANALLKKQNWLGSSYTRETLKEATDFQEAVDRFVMAPVNLRKQYLKVDNEKVGGFIRCGIIYDPRNGLVNLNDLKEMRKQIKNGGRYNLIQEKVYELSTAIEALKKEKAPEKTLQAFQYAHDKLESVSLYYNDAGLVVGCDLEQSIQTLDELIEDRRNALQDQFVHLIAEHVSENEESIKQLKEGEAFNFIHVAFLNRKAGKKGGKLIVKKPGLLRGWTPVGKNGWAHVEENNILDMNELFVEAKGKTLIFDGKGPFIDDEGKYHMPIEIRDKDGNSIERQFNPIFMNNTVQGHTKNDGVQKKINKQGLKELRQVLKSKSNNLKKSIGTNTRELAKAKKDLEKTNKQLKKENKDRKLLLKDVDKLKEQIRTDEAKLKKFEEASDNMDKFVKMLERKSDYYTAEELTTTIMKAEIPLSMGCQSAKDRAGTVAARTIMRLLELYLTTKIKDPKRRKSVWKRLQAKIFDKDRPLALVIDDCTDIKVAKIHRKTWSIPGFSGTPEGIRGKLRRLTQMIEMVGLKFSGRLAV